MKSLGLYLIAISILTLMGCSSIVKKPNINKVKTAAIISIYANSDVREANGGGNVKGWSDDLKQQVSLGFYDAYVDSFGKSLGWEMQSADELIESEEYKNMFRPEFKTKNKTLNKIGGFMNKLADMSEKNSYFTPGNMHPIEISHGNMKTVSYHNAGRKDVNKTLAAMAGKLGVDAVVVVQMDYCYEPTTLSLRGLSKAHMTAASTIRAVDKKGNMIVNMGDLKSCAKRKNRGKSKQGYGLLGGNIVVALKDQKELEQMFMEATNDNIRLTMKQLKKAMK